MTNLNINQCQINRREGLGPSNISVCGSLCVLVQARWWGEGVRACRCPAQGQFDPSPTIQAVQCRVRMTSDASTRPNVLHCGVVLDITIGRLGRQLNSFINNTKSYNS
jgi:hypothetical protein